MTLWLVLTAMISAAAVLLSAPFIRSRERTRLQATSNLAVYRDQLKEVEIELAQGLIDKTQAESADTEIRRRILVASGVETPTAEVLSRPERNFAVTSVSAIVIFGSILLYAIVGSPELPPAGPSQTAPDQGPVAAASSAAAANSASPTAKSPKITTANQPTTTTGGQVQTNLPPVEEMIERLQARLQRNAADPEGWRMLGWSYFSVERFADAANAYAKAIELRPASADYRSARGEALVRAADGIVTTEAKADFEQALLIDAKDARARFFVGLAKEQAGDKQAALADWNDLLAAADPSEPWLTELRQRVTDLRKELGDASAPAFRSTPDLSVAALQDFLQSEKARQAPSAPRGPSADDVRKAEGMTPQDRTAMIRSMVDGLASRLDQSPDDAEGWIKLIRSRMVLGEAKQAKETLQRALTQFSKDRPEYQRIVDAAGQLGIAP
ncbi:c-type cytochrome biogenesis protein CcmI [Bradyrhizobium sp. BR13661]|jgi:cytochrome c-type biogenesis protein CcmH|uniref:c-type cytochrome biogenesis protein CcmI n=1 Tax=Bradyrhizobium sp. BR13661 TaxID=2940622 RepID=UPI0024758D41|nr:c-type cytochrome biogenesis protein CcmI [Bradyrhizobium sp. BR13661]MDH6256441.1 cytochrome c-type biogenesis protein CcmH [Bradyrhizobium sp. BR13661]